MNPYDNIVSLLTRHGIEFMEIDHEPVYTSEQAAKVRGLSLDEGAKSLLLKTTGGFALIVLSGGKRLDSKKVRKELAVKSFRFATPEEVRQVMGCEIGSCYPFGSFIGVDTYLDGSLVDQAFISLNPGVHDKSIKLKLSDYIKIENPKKIEVSAG